MSSRLQRMREMGAPSPGKGRFNLILLFIALGITALILFEPWKSPDEPGSRGQRILDQVAKQEKGQMRVVERQKALADRVLKAKVYTDEPLRLETTFRALFDDLARRVNALAPDDPKSDLGRLNAAQPGTPVLFEPAAFEWLKAAFDVGGQVSDFVSIRQKPYYDLWSFNREEPKIASDADLAERAPRVAGGTLRFDLSARSVELSPAGAGVTLAPLLSGLILNTAAQALEAAGFHNYYLLIGGDYRAVGKTEGEEDWRVELNHPGSPLKRFGIIRPNGRFIMTSNGYTGFVEKEVEYPPFLDPATGQVARSGVAVALVAGPDALTAEALSHALFVAGETKGMEILSRFPGYDLLLIREDMTYRMTEGLAENVEIRIEPKNTVILKPSPSDPPSPPTPPGP